MWRPCLVAIALVLVNLAGCGKGSHGDDLSTPQSTVKSYVSAMKRGDAAAMKATITGGDPQLVDAIVSAQVSRKKLEDAAVAKFGEDGRGLVMGGEHEQNYEKLVDDAEVKQDGDTATVTPKDHSMPTGIVLKKVSGDWKIDMAAMPGVSQMTSMLPMLSRMSAMNDELAGEISAGKYKSVADARAAQMQKMMSAVTAGGTDASKPANLPH